MLRDAPRRHRLAATLATLAALACGDDSATTLAQVGTNGAAGSAGASGAVGLGGAGSSVTGGSSGSAGVAGAGAVGGGGASGKAGNAGAAGASAGAAGMPNSPYGPHLNCGIETLDESGALCAGTCTPTDRCSLPAKGGCGTPCTCINGAWKCGGVVACPSPQVTVGATCTPSEPSRWIDGPVWSPFLSDTHVYFTSDKQLLRAAVPCGEPETLAEFGDRVRIAGALGGKLILWSSPEDFAP